MSKPSLLKDTIKAIRACPSEIFNAWLFYCTAVWSFSGVAKGFDEGKHAITRLGGAPLIPSLGNIASIVVQTTFREDFGVSQETEARYAGMQLFSRCPATCTDGLS